MRGKKPPSYTEWNTELLDFIADFFTARTFPNAFDWKRQSARWKAAMAALSTEWELRKLEMTKTVKFEN